MKMIAMAAALGFLLLAAGPGGEAPPDWRAGLKDKDPIVRRRAVDWLVRRGEAADAFPALVAALKADEDWNVRTLSARGLGVLKDAKGVGPLRDALKDPVWNVRYTAARSLVRIADPSVVPDLLALAGDPETAIRDAVPEWLESFGKAAVAVLHPALAGRDGAARLAAFDALDRLGEREIAPPIMVWVNPHGQVVRYDATGISRLSDRACLAALTGALSDEDPVVRKEAALALGRIRDASAVPDLARAAADAEASVREAALVALREIRDPSALPVILRMLEDPDLGLAARAHEALDRLGEAARPALVEAFAAGPRRRRLEAARALVRTGASAIPELDRFLDGAEHPARLDAALAISRIGGEEAFEALRRRYPSGDPELEAILLAFLADWTGEAWPPDAPPSPRSVFDHFAKAGFERAGRGTSVEHWLPHLGSTDIRVRRAAVAALRDSRDLRALEELKKALEEADVPLKRAAAWALGALEGPAAAEPLSRALSDEDPIVRLAAAAGLVGRPGANGSALAISLEDKDLLVRFAAAGAIARMPEPPPEAPEAIRKALDACPREWPCLKRALEEAAGSGR